MSIENDFTTEFNLQLALECAYENAYEQLLIYLSKNVDKLRWSNNSCY